MAIINRSSADDILSRKEPVEGGEKEMAHKNKNGKKVKPSLMKAILREVARAIG